MHVRVAEGAVAVGIARRGDQADIFVIADGFWRQAGGLGGLSDVHVASSAGLMNLRRSAFMTTKTEDRAIAPAARAGDSKRPITG